MVKQEHDEFSRDKKAKLDEFETRYTVTNKLSKCNESDFNFAAVLGIYSE